ncbi:ATP-binding cassette domain-containing protein [Roseivivax sp. GX 12232]|uniref:ATP-binding cassette domain-containing protein n=1 Tax=Roseivivax sp. GX 12232 TaxID=2900547 RepID=UPI001E2F54F0|nr:ATP-binding cassette domain-containing protein [Roseivivax sp. GX 12232]MCE0506519.1 ATP-binding cassette domain-containing protein [Roseivivax sp. GX 12232]
MSDAAILPFERAEPSASLPRPIFPLAVRGLALSYGATQVLAGVDLDLGARGCTVVMGPNGAGKSLLLKLLHGLIAPSGGVIDWAGQSPSEVTRRQALVFQRPVLLRRSVGANIDFVLKARGLPRATVRERRTALLAHVGLAEKTDLPARRLSGGEAQRLALARALATEPEVLFLDEPTASLDPASALAIEEIVTRARDLGTRVIFVTHDVGQARRLADDVVFLHRGRVAEHRPAEAFFAAPRSEAAAGYLAGRIVV